MINMDHFEKWELESDLKAAKTKYASEKCTATNFGDGIAAQLGVRKKSVDEKKVNSSSLKRNYEIINQCSNNRLSNVSKTLDKKHLKLNSHVNIPNKVSSLVELNKRKNSQNGISVVVKDEKRHLIENHSIKRQESFMNSDKQNAKLVESPSIKRQKSFSNLNIKNTKTNILKNSKNKTDIKIENENKTNSKIKNEIVFKDVKNTNTNSSNTKSKRKSTDSTVAIATDCNTVSKITNLNQTSYIESNPPIKELSKPKSSIINPYVAPFYSKLATSNAATQTESSDCSLVDNKLNLKVLFRVVLYHDLSVNRPLKELFSLKGESLSNLFTKIVSDMSARRRSVESINDKCFISLNSRFAAFLTMDLSKLELIPEEESENECEPVRIFTVLNHKNYQFHIKNNCLLPDIIVTRLYPR